MDKIKVFFPEIELPYYIYEAIQIFGAVDSLAELYPNSENLVLEGEAENGRIVKCFPEGVNTKEIKRSVYIIMCGFTGRTSPWGCMTGIRPAKMVNQMKSLGIADIKAELMNFYLLREDKAELTIETSETQKKFLHTSGKNAGFYAGVPFCPSRCLYCSFTSNPIDKYKNVFHKYIDLCGIEIKETANLINEYGYTIESLYVGGGTPTSLDAGGLDKFLGNLCNNLDLSNLKEFDLEAGRPDSITADKLKIAKDYGVNRLSINPQSMNDETLKLIGRKHTSAQIIEAFELARNMGFDNINMDIIAGLPGETQEMFLHTLEEAGKLKPESLTVHTLSIKRSSKLKDDVSILNSLDSSQTGDMVSAAYEFAHKLNMKPYYLYRQKNMLGNHENVAYCKNGCESLYNIHIMEEDQTIFGIGAGAVTKAVSGDRIERAYNVKSVEDYLSRLQLMVERKRKLFENL
ncbi:MAG: coproporphyrinogen dehydrogenase HemZ [Clostridiales bacterium]|jgi:oxygen-independent coproporphyrinogen-3 oxidase|nr:coproporphyrinogen dehydrogenase HemZ [Clostridiales bacterium]